MGLRQFGNGGCGADPDHSGVSAVIRAAMIQTMKAGRHVVAAITPWLSDRRYLDVYALTTDIHAKVDPSSAVGGNWDRTGRAYFEALKALGLAPHQTFLDLGCGSLRIGYHVIAYLEPGNYVGADMSSGVLDAGKAVIEREGLQDKRARLIRTRGEVDFSFVDQTFDFIFAASVFTHLRPHMIEECLSSAHKVMHSGSVFYFTFMEGDEIHAVTAKQPISFYEAAAERCGLLLAMHPEHDSGRQRLASVRLPT